MWNTYGGRGVTVAISACEADGAGSIPVDHPNFVEQGRVTVATVRGWEPLNHEKYPIFIMWFDSTPGSTIF